MSNQKLWQQYQAILEKADFIVTYSALSDEISVEKTPHFEIIKDKPKFLVQPTHKIEPKEVANEIKSFIENLILSPRHCCAGAGTLSNTHRVFSGPRRALIFLPGQKYDLKGTRHGRGFGWYDRLLAELPSNWIRVGIADESKISITPLTRNKWDQPMDWLVWKDKNGLWKIIKTPNQRN